MKKILIFGNSGSGKSTLAKNICESDGLAHLDLDLLAWQDIQPPTRKSLVASGIELENFINAHESWVIEGCYSDLLELVEQYATEIIFMDLSIDDCILNAKARPWEPHKYESKQAQDNNLAMLISWISQYTERTDTFSKLAHQSFYDNYLGKKISITSNSN